MDRECVSLMPRVCEVLADSARPLPDDTSLEKLLDWLTELSNTGGCLLESCPCLLEFISTVVHNSTLDPGVLSFSLKLTGLVAGSEDGFKRLKKCSALDLVFNLQHWKEAGLWDDPSIRIGWIQGLRNMLQHPKALSFFVQSGLIEPLLQLQTDTSVFVASAANQMLAHILLFFQPPSSVGGKGLTKKDEDDQRIHGSSVAITLDYSLEYTALITAISNYLRESLVPSENAQPVQSLQLLKLLALLLDQARLPLRDTLLETVAQSLEELVKSHHSQLTLPLMEVLLAAHSSSADKPDKHVTHLLLSMMNINKPADLIHAAAALLRRGHYDKDHMSWAGKILLLPLEIITGQSMLSSSTAEIKHQFSTMEQLKSRTACISMICISLANTPKIALMPADVLPCPPGVILTAVLSLLNICSGYMSVSHTGCDEIFRNIIGSGKVQKCALEALTALSCCPEAEEKLSTVFTVLIHYLNNPDSDPTVLHKSYQALIKWLSVCDPSSVPHRLRQELAEVVKKRACDMRWEVRDSTVEFLGNMAGGMKSAEEACDVLGSPTCTAALLKEALHDPESYVRASSISALAQTQGHSWQQGATITQEQTEIVSQLLQILSQDTEGFPRREVILYFIAWFSSSSSHLPLSLSTSSSSSLLLMKSVHSVLTLGTADLDWEVKVHTLKLADLLLDEAFFAHSRKSSESCPALLHPYAVVCNQTYTLHTHSNTQTEIVEPELARTLSNLVEMGVISALLSGLVDCDRPVALKACQLLIKLRDTVCPLKLRALDATAAVDTVTRVSCELPGWGWGNDIKKMLAMKLSCGANEVSATDGRSFSGADMADSEVRDQGVKEGGACVRVGVWGVLEGLDLEERLAVLTKSSDHVHNSPLSLLQDILTANAAHTLPHTEPGQEVIVDCY